MTSAQRFALIVVILALIGWAGFARVVRGMVLSIKKEDNRLIVQKVTKIQE
jgi:peptide/nickel transport system permease protein